MDNLIYECLNNGYKTKRLILRKLSIYDVDDMFEYTSDIRVCKYLNWGPHKSINETMDFINKTIEKYMKPSDIVWGLEYNGKLIGVLRIYNINSDSGECDISYVLSADYQGKGFMTEAVNAAIYTGFYILFLNKVNAYYIDENISSYNVMNRCKMMKSIDINEEVIIKGKHHKLKRCEIRKDLI